MKSYRKYMHLLNFLKNNSADLVFKQAEFDIY